MPFKNRKTWFIDYWDIKGWQLKVYGMVGEGKEISSDVVAAARDCAAEQVPFPAPSATGSLPRCGFVTIHFGEEAVWLLIDVWAADILRHFLYYAPTSDPTNFRDGPNDGTMACVWELSVVDFERDSWVEHIFSNPAPNIEAWRNDTIALEP